MFESGLNDSYYERSKAALILDRLRWAEYFEEAGVRYAFFSAADAAARQEQADKQRRRAEGEEDEEELSDEDDEEEDEENADEQVSGEEVEQASGEEVESEDDEEDQEEGVIQKMKDANLQDEDEEGWSTEGEDVDAGAEGAGEADEKSANGERVPLQHIAREVAQQAAVEVQEDVRTRVLSVTELEDLFISSAPDLSGMSHYSIPASTSCPKIGDAAQTSY